jgi:cytoskeletal protein RodZ
MLPKPEKNKKKLIIDSESETSKVSDPQLAQKRAKTKRRLVLLSLFLTVGLSFIFWSIKHVQKLLASPPKINFDLHFKLPEFNKNISIKETNSSSDLDKYIKSLTENWAVYVSLVSNPKVSIYQNSPGFNLDSIPSIVTNLSSTKSSSQSLVNLNLPQGLLFQESLDSNKSFVYQNIISLPKNKLLFLIKIDNPKDIDQAKKELPILIDKIYWYSVSKIN